MTDPIVGSVGVAVVPNAEDFWRRFREQTKAGAEEGVKVKVRADTGDAEAKIAGLKAEAGAGSAEVKVKADTKDAQFQMHLLRDSIIGIGPAAIPVAAVAGGALLGLLPVAATVALAVGGISKQMKSSALQGTQFATNVNALKTEVSSLQQTAASGVLTGLNQAIGQSAPLFKTVNADVAVMSGQLGNIVAGVAPALVQILTDLNPLFVTFGNVLTGGAKNLAHFAQSGTGIQSFVAYVQAELPVVVHDVGQLVVLASHLLQALAPMGNAILQGIGTLASVLNAIPINVLTVLADGALATYAAFRTYAGITSLLKPVNAALIAHAATAAAAAETVRVSSAATELAAADETVAVASAKAEEASAVARANAAILESSAGIASLFDAEAIAATNAAREITASWAGVPSMFATDATLIAEASAEEAAAFRAAAEAATLSAEEIAAAQKATVAATERGALTSAALGFTRLLGPLAAVGVGVSILTGLFANNNEQAANNQKIINSYTQSLQQSADALAGVNIAQTNKNLQDDGALKLVDKLNKGNADLGITYGQVALAVNGSESQFKSLISTLQGVAEQNSHFKYGSNDTVKLYNDQGHAALDLIGKLQTLHSNLTTAEQLQEQYAAAQQQAQIAIDGGTSAVAAQAREYGTTTDAYLAAQQAAKKNTDQTQAQTLAYQQENDAASILKQTLDELNGKKLSAADAQNAFESSLVNFTTGGSPGTTPSASQQAAAGTAATQHKIALDALAIAQQKYNAAVKSGNPQQQAAAHLALERAQLAVTTSTNAVAAANSKLASTGYVAAGTILGMDAASVQLRGELNQQVHNLEALVEANGGWANSTAASRTEMEKLRQQVIDNAVAHGVDRKAVTDYVDALFKIPKTIPPTKLDIDTAAAQRSVDWLRRYIKKHIESIKITANIVANVTAAARTHDVGGRGTIFVDIASAQGNLIDYNANGAARIRHFAGGGEDHTAQIAPAGAYRVWAEEETGGEAYIPLAESKRTRSEDILAAVAARFGGSYERVSSAAGPSIGTFQQNNYWPTPSTVGEAQPVLMRRALASIGHGGRS